MTDGGTEGAPRPRASVWRCGRHELRLERPLVMGILNVTPDSFSDGGLHDDPIAAIGWADHLIAEGADIIDVGGESTRPGSADVPVSGELARVRPLVTWLADNHADVPTSIDTRHAEVAAAAIDAGASIINDVSGFRDPAMIEVAAASDVGVVVMHMLGEPGTMQHDPRYENVVTEVGGYLLAQAAVLEAAGVARERIAIDPGIGFGKTLEHNIALIRALPQFAEFGYAVLLGASRKRFIGEITATAEPAQRVGGSVGVALWGAAHGAHVLRVHDVAATVQALAVTATLNQT